MKPPSRSRSILVLAAAALAARGQPDPRGAEGLMGVPAGAHADAAPRPPGSREGFFFNDMYDPAMAVPTDTVQIYVGPNEDPRVAASWRAHGYSAQLFLHSRYGSEVGNDPYEDQTDATGSPIGVIGVTQGGKQVDLAVGRLTPHFLRAMADKHGANLDIRMIDNYKIPTLKRVALARRYYRDAITPDISAFCFDEPEIWANAGYSQAFKDEWVARYGEPWRPPESGVDARYKAERLKAFLIRRWTETILEDVRATHPSVTRLMAMHSPSNYYEMGMSTPHHLLVTMPALQEVVAEVWNDPFDMSFLEYSSFWNLTRDGGPRLWFMMDPLGDSPGLSTDFYRRSYANNLVAALMYPQIDRFEPQIWPNRLYGHVPDDYEVTMDTVAGALSELWRFPDGSVEAGSPGIGTFVADSMGWQRSLPAPSDFDGFYGMATPLVNRGIPVEVYSLDRVEEPGYLAKARCLLLSYDLMKPPGAETNEALAAWVRSGGTLVCFGGSDPYNAVSDAWWRKAGFSTPLEELFARLGIRARDPETTIQAGLTLRLHPTAALGADFPPEVAVTTGPGRSAETFERFVCFWQTEQPPSADHPAYPVTRYEPGPGAAALLADNPGAKPVAWSHTCGKGSLVFVGIAPGYFRAGAGGPETLRALVRHALVSAGGAYEEHRGFIARRGPYAAVAACGSRTELAGRYVDLLSATLEVAAEPAVEPSQCAFFKAFPPAPSHPTLLAASGRVDASYESHGVTSWVIRAPSKTPGLCRVWGVGRTLERASAFSLDGKPLAIQEAVAADTVLLRFPNDASGVVVRADWRP